MLAIKVPLKEAEKVKKLLCKNGLLGKEYGIRKEEEFIYFPVAERFSSTHPFVQINLPEVKKETFRDVLHAKLTDAEREWLKTAYDVIGDIAILEIDRELRKKEKLIAELLLQMHKNLRTVLRKDGGHAGEFRTQKLRYLAGEDKRETVHKENSVALKLDVGQVYFSPRLARERLRVAKQVRKGEKILVMFSGCGPYVCVIGKLSQPGKVVGIEINPVGHAYAVDNVMQNRLRNIQLFNGDVRAVVPRLKEKFDRILMPLPKSAGDFLDTALSAANRSAVIHFYDFQKETEFDKAVDKVKAACMRNKMKCEILGVHKCGQHAPYTFRVCVDAQIR